MYVCNNSILKPRRFQAEKQAMRDMMLNALEEKRKRLRDEKDNENDIANGMVKALAVRITYSWMYESNCSSCSLQISSFLRIKRAIASVYYARGEEYLTRNLWLVTDRLIVWWMLLLSEGMLQIISFYNLRAPVQAFHCSFHLALINLDFYPFLLPTSYVSTLWQILILLWPPGMTMSWIRTCWRSERYV